MTTYGHMVHSHTTDCTQAEQKPSGERQTREERERESLCGVQSGKGGIERATSNVLLLFLCLGSPALSE